MVITVLDPRIGSSIWVDSSVSLVLITTSVAMKGTSSVEVVVSMAAISSSVPVETIAWVICSVSTLRLTPINDIENDPIESAIVVSGPAVTLTK